MNTSNLTPMTNIKQLSAPKLEKLTPIEQLADSIGLGHAEDCYSDRDDFMEQLESLRKAIILDMLVKLESSAWKYRYMSEGKFVGSIITACDTDLEWLKKTYPEFEIVELYDLSEFKDTPK